MCLSHLSSEMKDTGEEGTVGAEVGTFVGEEGGREPSTQLILELG